MLQGLSKELDFPLNIDGASKGAWDLIDATDGGISILHLKKEDNMYPCCTQNTTQPVLLVSAQYLVTGRSGYAISEPVCSSIQPAKRPVATQWSLQRTSHRYVLH